MATASDNFQRANGALGANWTDWFWVGSVGCVIASDRAAGSSEANTTSGDFWSAGSFGGDQYSRVTVAAVPAAGEWVGVTARQSGEGVGYLGIWFEGTYYLFNENGTPSPPLLTSASGSLSAADTIMVKAVGTTVSLYRNGAQVLTATDSTYASGAPGIAFFGASGAVSGWDGGDVLPAVTVSTTAVANVAEGTEVRRWLTASGGAPPYTWAVTSGSLPAGMSLAADGTLGGTPTGVGESSFTVTATDSASQQGTASLSVTSVSAPLSPSGAATDGNGVITWQVTSAINMGTAQTIRVLRPSLPNAAYPHGFLVTLPVAAGTDDTSFGNGLDTVRALGLHNLYNLTVIEPSTGGNWLADNPSDSSLLQETYLLQVTAWASATYGSGGEKTWLIGFSRTGIGGQGLFLHRPDLYAGVASWDFPAMMTSYDGGDPDSGPVGGSPASSYGTADNFTANYELSPANLARWAAGTDLGTTRRVWTGGYHAFQADVADYDPVLTTAGIGHFYAAVAASEHNWAPDPGWVGPALASLIPEGNAEVTWQVAINEGASGVVLPNGLRYPGGTTGIVLSGEQYALLSPGAPVTATSLGGTASYDCTVAEGLVNVMIPAGLLVQGGDSVTLADWQYGSMTAAAVAAIFSSVTRSVA